MRFLLLTLALIGAAHAQLVLEKPEKIIDGDNRKVVRSRDYPFNAIGRLQIRNKKDSWFCTATLIAEDLILTNSHCVYTDDQKLVDTQDITFELSVIRDRPIEESSVKRIHTPIKEFNFDTYSTYDWAILQLKKKLGKKYAYLKIDRPGNYYLRKRSYVIGHSGDIEGGDSASYDEQDCDVESLNTKVVYHNCDTNPGASGSAVLRESNGKYYVIALHKGSSGKKNIATSTRLFYDFFKFITERNEKKYNEEAQVNIKEITKNFYMVYDYDAQGLEGYMLNSKYMNRIVKIYDKDMKLIKEDNGWAIKIPPMAGDHFYIKSDREIELSNMKRPVNNYFHK